METFTLGIDGGGTKTAALILDSSGRERGRGTGGPCNIASHLDAALADSVRAAVASACDAAGLEMAATRFRGVCAGVAGYSAPSRREPFLRVLQSVVNAESYRLEGDFVIAWQGATGGEPGIIVIAGTGAVAYGRNASGQEHQEDGLGYLLGDRGSGFFVGMQALHHAVSHLREENTTLLTDAVLAQIGASDLGSVVQWLYPGFATSRVAELAPLVGKLADAGDGNSQVILYNASQRLRITVSRTLRKLALPPDTPIYPLGGLWRISPLLRTRFEVPRPATFIDPDGKPLDPQPDRRLRLAEPKRDAVYGAAQLAREGGN